MAATTITVPTELRDRIIRNAQDRGLTAAGLIEELLDASERCRRMESFALAFRQAGDLYWDDFGAWDAAQSVTSSGE